MGVHASVHTRSWCTVVTLLLALISVDDLHVHALIAEEALSESPMSLAPRVTAYFNMTDKPVVITMDSQALTDPVGAAITISFDGIVDRAVMTIKQPVAGVNGSNHGEIGREEWNFATSSSVECFSFIVDQVNNVPNLCTVAPLRLSRRIQHTLPLVELTLYPLPPPATATVTAKSAPAPAPSTLISATLLYASKTDLPLDWFDYLAAPSPPQQDSSTSTKAITKVEPPLRVTTNGNSFSASWDVATRAQTNADGDAIDCEECLYMLYYAKLPPGLVGAALSDIRLNSVLNVLRYGNPAGEWSGERTIEVAVQDKGSYLINVLAKVDPSDHTSLLEDVELLTTIYAPVRVSLAEDTSSFFWVSLIGLGVLGVALGGFFAYRKLKERRSGGGHVLGGGNSSGGGGGGGQGFRPMPI